MTSTSRAGAPSPRSTSSVWATSTRCCSPPAPGAEADHFDIFQNYEIEANDRDGLRAHLESRGVKTIIQWGGKVLHQFPKLNLGPALDYAEKMSQRFMLLLPMNTALSDQDIHYICDSIAEFYASGAEGRGGLQGSCTHERPGSSRPRERRPADRRTSARTARTRQLLPSAALLVGERSSRTSRSTVRRQNTDALPRAVRALQAGAAGEGLGGRVRRESRLRHDDVGAASPRFSSR